jgi:D-beta-D-heptose 7-phosphate kinase/D-beta-D-heptose 1-phosphate adenosyltransferase
VPAWTREVWDVSGAGDTVIAIFALGIAAGGSVLDAAQLANLAAGIVVGKVGTATASTLELSDAIDAADEHLETQSELDNVVTRDQAVEQVARWRRMGLKVGFTNGVFDLLHPGHVSSLRFAKSKCDRLVVGVNSDASVRELKGPARPIQDEQHRSFVLAALGFVDLVVVFPEASSENLIAAIMPDVLLKGGDYKPHEVVGAGIVTNNGGEVIITPTLDGFSTTNIVTKHGIVRQN